MTFDTLLFSGLAAGLPFIWLLYALVLRRLRHEAPDDLHRIDPYGYRALNASSQVRFGRYVLARHYGGLPAGGLRTCLDVLRWLLIGYAVLLTCCIILVLN